MLYIDYLLSDSERNALLETGVEFSELSLGNAAYHRHGVAYEEDEAETVMEILGLLGEPGDYEDLYNPQGQIVRGYWLQRLIDLPTRSNPIVWAGRAARMQRGSDEDTYRRYLPQLQPGLVVHLSDYGVRGYRHRSGVLFVNILSSPVEDRSDRESGMVRGYRIYATGLNADYQVINDSDGEPLAYFRGDAEGGSLWVLFSPYDQRDRDLLDYVMHSAARLMHPELGEPMNLGGYRTIALRERYIGLARQRLEQEMECIDDAINDAEETVAEARRALVGALRNAEAFRLRRQQLQNDDPNELVRQFEEHLAGEFDALSDMSDVQEFEFDHENIVVTTRPIDIHYQGRVYEMGSYKIHLGPFQLSITHTDPYFNRGSTCHPHVSGGEPCLGNLSEAAAKMQASMQFATLVQLLVRYLEVGYNPADSYRRIENFDVPSHAEEEEVEGERVAVEGRRGRRGRRRDSR